MVPKIIILPLAQLDIKESIDYYKEKSHHLSNNFIDSINNSFSAIKNNPKTYPIVKIEIRKYKIKDFPFCIYYIDRNDKIYILAVFHDKRNPSIWEEREIELI